MGAATPAKGFRRLLTRQGTGVVRAGGSWAGAGMVQHQVHAIWRKLGLGQRRGELQLPCSVGTEKGEEWVQQAGWGGAARGRRQMLVDGQEDVSEEAAADESYGERQMLCEGMAGRSWVELVQQCGVPVHGGASPAAEIDCSLDGGDWTSVG